MQESTFMRSTCSLQSNGGVATTPPTHTHLSTLKTYPTPGEGPIPFLHQNDRKGCPDSYYKSFRVKMERFRVSGKNL